MNEFEKKKFDNQIGITAKIDRFEEGGETMARANRALNDIGDFIHAEIPQLKGLEYCGSMSVHIYKAPMLGQAVYVTQTQPLLQCEEILAGPASTQLKKDAMRHFGRDGIGKTRSGF